MPKRKAVSKLSALVNDDDDDALVGEVENVDENTDIEPPPAKRPKGRPKGTGSKTTIEKPQRKTRSTAVARPKPRAPKPGVGRSRKPIEDPGAEAQQTADSNNGEDGQKEGEIQSAHGSSEDELDSPQTVLPPPKNKAQPKPRRGRKPAAAKQNVNQAVRDGEFEYTPTGTTMADKSQRQIKKQTKKPVADKENETVEAGEHQTTTPVNKELANGRKGTRKSTTRKENQGIPFATVPSSPLKGQTPHANRRTPGSIGKRQKVGSPSEPENASGEAALRRRLGDMTKKYDTLESHYRTLREVGIIEANSNMEKLRTQVAEMTATSSELVAALKKELVNQTNLAQGARELQTQLDSRNKDVSQLEKRLEGTTADLNKAQSEVKTLQTKLTASRKAAVNVETARPGTSARNGASSRLATKGGAESAQISQLKEDLYSDLTGLIIRDVKKRESDHVYDCIQTGLNGTLHFKLVVNDGSDNRTATSLETAEFHYMPLLDQNRDRDLIGILPEYLTVDITFSRQHAPRFYSRVVDTLTKKQLD